MPCVCRDTSRSPRLVWQPLLCATAGYWCPLSQPTATTSQCQVGSYGTVASAGTATAATCAGPCTCAAGSYCAAGSTSTAGTACTAGNFCTGGSAAPVACTCAAGSYCPVSSTATTGVACMAGNFCTGATAAAAVCTCTAGRYCPVSSSTTAGVACTPQVCPSSPLVFLWSWAAVFRSICCTSSMGLLLLSALCRLIVASVRGSCARVRSALY